MAPAPAGSAAEDFAGGQSTRSPMCPPTARSTARALTAPARPSPVSERLTCQRESVGAYAVREVYSCFTLRCWLYIECVSFFRRTGTAEHLLGHPLYLPHLVVRSPGLVMKQP